VVVYVDATVALPILTAYALAVRGRRPLKRLYDRRAAMMALLEREHRKALDQAQR
jgi:deoxyhypusine synthase